VTLPGVFLDRDGVIVELVWDDADGAFEAPNVRDDVALVPGAAAAIRRLRALGFRTVVVSNQPAAAKGRATLADLDGVHERFVQVLGDAGASIDAYRYCMHHPEGVDPTLGEACGCRKPKPGMLLDAAAELGLELSASWMIGDSDTDIEAGLSAGCRAVLVENRRSAHRRSAVTRAEYRAANLGEAVAIIAADRR
jgi:D-glycero-D-manno-heptose 1,7-bisphosphate phosphatase